MDAPTREELATLPRRALVAFAVRCARRVQPLLYGEKVHVVTELGTALDLATRFAKGEKLDPGRIRAAPVYAAAADADAADAAYAAADAYAAYADADADAAYAAANNAANADVTGNDIRAVARSDFEALKRRSLGKPGNLGRPINPRKTGR